MKAKTKFSLSILMLLLALQSFAVQSFVPDFGLKDLPKVKVRKTGPYIGLQKGKYNLIEFGGEMQFKRMKLLHPQVNAFRMGFNYDFKYNVLGYDAGYWHQRGRLGLTFGALLSYRTNFTHGRIGAAPMIGFRFLQFHLQTGYHFYNPSESFTEVNHFFIALKFVIISKRHRDID